MSNSVNGQHAISQAYAAAHQHPINRALHLVGIPLIIVSSLAALSPRRPFGWSRRRAVGGVLTGWGLLFLGHGIEGTPPVILSRPTAIGTAPVWWLRGVICRRPSLVHGPP